MSANPPSRWEKRDASVIAVTRIFEVKSQRYWHPVRRIEKEFAVVQAPDWVNVIAVTPDGRLALINQFRFGLNGFSLEIPGGIMDQGEDPVAAGLRELREETGYGGKNARVIGIVHPNPAFQTNRCHLVLVEDAQRTGDLDWDDDEEIEVRLIPVDEVYALARSGTISHSLVLDGLFFFQPHWESLRRRLPNGADS